MMTDDRLSEIEARLNNRHRSSGDNDLFKEHAPTDLRDLLAEVRRLRQGCETCRHRDCGATMNAFAVDWCDKFGRLCDDLGHRCGAWEKRDEHSL